MRNAWAKSSFLVGWRQLSFGKSRMLVALLGVSVAVLLMLTLLTLSEAVQQSALLVPSSYKGEVLVLSPKTQSVMRAAAFPRRLLERLRGIEGVQWVSPVFVENARWTNPWTRQEHIIRVHGLDLQDDVLGLDGIDADNPVLHLPDTVLFDRLSRPKYGPVAEELQNGRTVDVEVNGRRVTVRDLTSAGITVGVDGNLFTTVANYQRIFALPRASGCHVGIVRLKPGVSPEAVRDAAQTLLGREALVLTKAQVIDLERRFMKENDPINFIMGLISAVAFLVGLIIVYQILYSDVINHLSQFATLKAMGFSDGFLLRVILSEGVILSILGYWPGLLGSFALTHLTRYVITLPISLTPARMLGIFALTLVMCLAAALLAVRKVRSADPASAF